MGHIGILIGSAESGKLDNHVQSANKGTGKSMILNKLLDSQAPISYNLGMNRLPVAKRAQILSLLCEGVSMRAVSRLVDCSINTVTRELIQAGEACADYHDRTVRGVTSKRIQCDEIWSFVGMKDKTAKRKDIKGFGLGDVWTWTAIDADSKICVSWYIGNRDAGAAYELMMALQDRLANRVQLTTDGHKSYLSAIAGAFGTTGIDYATLVKVYGPDTNEANAHRYSPPQCLGTDATRVYGAPDPDHISTSYVERRNLTMRMHMRRFTRLTNAFSKKVENHAHMAALYTLWCNFCRVHMTLRVTPAMAAGIATSIMPMEKVVEITDEWEAKQPHQKVGRKPKAGKSN
jgi:IS1 family transposase